MKTLAIFTIFVLIFGTASTSLVNNAYAQNDLNILLRIAGQADTQIYNQLTTSYGTDDQWPSDIKSLYEKGHTAVVSIDESLPDNPDQAKKDFLIAMKSFRQISKMLSEPITESKVTTSDVSNKHLSSQLDRIEKYVKTLKTISEKHGSDIDFEQVDNLIREARDQVDNGIGDSSEIIDQLKRLINSIQKEIREYTSHGASDRVKQFVNKQLDNIERKLGKALDAGADQTQIDKAHQLIDEIKTLISENQIENAKIVFHELNKLLKNIERSVR
jgi:hypothetical protein